MAEERRVLHITNITHDCSEVEIADLFGIAGDVQRCVIIKDKFPFNAFVQYASPGDARRGLNINGKSLGPSRIAVEYSRKPYPAQEMPRRTISTLRDSHSAYPTGTGRPPVQLMNPGREVQVQMALPTTANNSEVVDVQLSNVPVTLKEHNIHQIFSTFGSITGVTLFTDASGLATGSGKVSFTSLQSATRAAAEMDGKKLEGGFMPLKCSVSAKFSEPPRRTSLMSNSSLTSNNNSRFHPYSQSPNQQPIYNNPQHYAPQLNNMPLGTSFNPNFTSPQQYNSMSEGHPMQANLPGNPQGQSSVYVGGLPETSCKNCLLYQLFAPYGSITSVKAMEGKKIGDEKSSHWFGFVNYKDHSGALLACQTLDKSTLDGQVLKVVLKTEKPGVQKNTGRNQRLN